MIFRTLAGVLSGQSKSLAWIAGTNIVAVFTTFLGLAIILCVAEYYHNHDYFVRE